MIPRVRVLMVGHGYINYIVKMHYICKNLLLYSWAWISQIEYMYIVMMTKKGSTKIVNFMTSEQGSCARVWP